MHGRDEDKRFRAGRTSGRQTSAQTPQARDRANAEMSSEEARSLDFVQRMIVSALIVVVFGLFAAALAGYIAVYPDEPDTGNVVGLWVMTGVIGLVSTAAVLVINRRRPYSPWVMIGLLPMIISAYWVF